MGTYIREFFEEERKGCIFGILSKYYFRNHFFHFMVSSKKTVRSIQSWSLESFSAEVFHSFWPIYHYQRRRGMALAQKSLFQPSLTIRHKYPNRYKHNQVSELIILGRIWRKVSSRDKKVWCLEVSHEDFDFFYLSSSRYFRSVKRLIRRKFSKQHHKLKGERLQG